jgi:hypothetical protein
MSNDAEAPGMGRLWGGGAGREKPVRAEPQRSADNVAQLRPDRTYVAHEIRDQAQRLQVCCATQPSRYPAYSSLLDIIHDHNFDRAFTLVYSFMLVEVTGAHLGAVVQAISSGNCGRIREFHSRLYDRPQLNEPVIESIITITAAVGGTKGA